MVSQVESHEHTPHKGIVHVSSESWYYRLAASLHSLILWRRRMKEEDLPWWANNVAGQASETEIQFATFSMAQYMKRCTEFRFIVYYSNRL